MVMRVENMVQEKHPREVVLAYVYALNEEDFQQARQYVSDDMVFDGALASRHGAEEIFADLERMRLKYDIKKIFADGDDVCLFYDVTLFGVPVFTCA